MRDIQDQDHEASQVQDAGEMKGEARKKARSTPGSGKDGRHSPHTRVMTEKDCM